MTAAYIEPDNYVREARQSNGLVRGHAYAITRISLLDYRGRDVKLIRLRNPWGNEVEWTGPWSDKSPEWNYIDDNLKKQMDYKVEKEGEFWMSYEDFLKNFDNIQFCNLTPDAFSEEMKKDKDKDNSTWKMVAYHGEWVNGKSAGGCGQGNPQNYWMNPQFLVTLTSLNANNNCTIILSLLQKYTRENRIKQLQESTEEFIQFRIYKIKNSKDAEASKRNGAKLYAHQLEKCATSDAYINRREITKRFTLKAGDYLIIPSCYDYGNEGEFLLRVFTEKAIEGTNAQILSEDKKVLTEEDIYFFKSTDADQSFSSWINLISNDDQLLSEEQKPSLSRPSSSRIERPASSTISNIVIRSSFLSNKHEQAKPTNNEQINSGTLEKDIEMIKVLAKIEKKETVQEACNIM